MYLYVLFHKWKFCFSDNKWKHCSCPAWLVSQGVLLEWPFLARGVGVDELSSSSSRWWRPGGHGLFFPMHPVQCLLHREISSGGSTDTTSSLLSPHTVFSTELKHRSHDPEHRSCWSDLCCSRHFSFKYSFIKHEVRPLLTFRDEYSLVSAL